MPSIDFWIIICLFVFLAVTIGHHNDTICSVSHNKLHNIIVSGGYDSTIRLWSTQQNKEDASVGTITTEKEVDKMRL